MDRYYGIFCLHGSRVKPNHHSDNNAESAGTKGVPFCWRCQKWEHMVDVSTSNSHNHCYNKQAPKASRVSQDLSTTRDTLL